MTEKELTNSVGRLLVDLHAARSFLDRLDAQLRNLIGSECSRTSQDERGGAATAFERVGCENYHADPTNATDTLSRASDEIRHGTTQGELFRDVTKMRKNNAKQGVLHKKGSITLSRRQVLDNLRRFSAGKDLLDLADVNRILGFHKTTSGSFVRLAVRRGDLGSVPVGNEWKFLPIDVRSFVRRYFDRKAKGLEQ